MADYIFDLDTLRGQPYYVVTTAEANWIIIAGAPYTAPEGQFALKIALQDYTYGATNPNISDLTFTSWDEFGTPTTLLNVDFSSYLDNVIGGAGGDKITGNDGALGNYIQGDSIDLAGGADFIMAKAGNDTVVGAGGSDSIYGGDGNDVIYGDWDRWSLYTYM